MHLNNMPAVVVGKWKKNIREAAPAQPQADPSKSFVEEFFDCLKIIEYTVRDSTRKLSFLYSYCTHSCRCSALVLCFASVLYIEPELTLG